MEQLTRPLAFFMCRYWTTAVHRRRLRLRDTEGLQQSTCFGLIGSPSEPLGRLRKRGKKAKRLEGSFLGKHLSKVHVQVDPTSRPEKKGTCSKDRPPYGRCNGIDPQGYRHVQGRSPYRKTTTITFLLWSYRSIVRRRLVGCGGTQFFRAWLVYISYHRPARFLFLFPGSARFGSLVVYKTAVHNCSKPESG